MRFIHDGPEYFPKSVVLYVRFEHHTLRQYFSYLREREMIFQKDVHRLSGKPGERDARIKLAEVQAQLIFMVSNLK